MGKHGCRNVSQFVSMGQGRRVRCHQIRRQARHLGTAQIQAHRRDSHNSAASLTMIDRAFNTPTCPGRNGPHAGSSRRSPGIQARDMQQPAGMEVLRCRKITDLGFVPLLIGLGNIIRIWRHDPPQTASGLPHQQAVGGKQGHLGIVRNPGQTILKVVPANAFFSVSE